MTKKELTIAVRKPAGLPLGPQKRDSGVLHRYKQKDLPVYASLSSQRTNRLGGGGLLPTRFHIPCLLPIILRYFRTS